jgi:uncharacterized protein (TIGR03435 family)
MKLCEAAVQNRQRMWRCLALRSFRVPFLPLVSLWLCCFSDTTIAQTSSPISSAPVEVDKPLSASLPAFDVVSIRPSKESGNLSWEVTMNGYRAREFPLAFTILRAYFPLAYVSIAFESKAILVGAPDWVWNDPYDFQGKVASVDLAEWASQRLKSTSMAPSNMLQKMLQAALADRCKLVVHHIPGETQGYALVVGGHGLNRKRVKESTPDEKIPSIAQQISGGGRMVPIMPNGVEALSFYQTPMATFVAQVTGFLDVPVEDLTGLPGKYDFTLTRWRTDQGFEWDFEALGLELRRAKVSTKLLVIDHIEKPTPN